MSQYPTAPPEHPPAAPRTVRVSLPKTTPFVTYVIIAVTGLMYLLQSIGPTVPGAQVDWLTYVGALTPGAIRAGQLWRFLTPILLHASIYHIGFNMYAVWIFGVGLERYFGHWRYLVLYLLAGFTGNVVSFLHLPAGEYSLGASTAIFGLVAAEGIFLLQNRQLFGAQFGSAIGNVIFIVAVNLALGAFTTGIDNWGHVGGLLGGLFFTLFAGPVWRLQQVPDPSGLSSTLQLVDERDPRMVVTGAAAVILVFGVLAALGMGGPLVR